MYQKIKRQNGETFAKAIRDFDNGILEISDIDKTVRYAGNKAEPILLYLSSLKGVKIEPHSVHRNPIELLKEAGYIAFYANTLKKQNSIKHLYAAGEEICTFNDKSRYVDYYIIHCVKENVLDIKRENFLKPAREDDYGRSVISIQILKSGGNISIKNRYNHIVNCCDNTFNSNPDNIIEGLSDSLRHYFKVDFSSNNGRLPNNYVLIKSQIYHYNYEMNNVYFGQDSYARDGKIYDTIKEREVVLDNFILDLKTQEIRNPSGKDDAFIDSLRQEISGKKLQIIKTDKGSKKLLANGEEIVEFKDGVILSVNFPNIEEVGNHFLSNNYNLHSIKLDKVKRIGNYFLANNKKLKTFDFGIVENIGDYFLSRNNKIKNVVSQHLKKVGNAFMSNNNKLERFELPKIDEIGNDCLYQNKSLQSYDIGKAKKVGHSFLKNNENISFKDKEEGMALAFMNLSNRGR